MSKIDIKNQTSSKDTTHKIAGCVQMEVDCPLVWENLEKTKNEKIRFCNSCKQNITHVQNNKELDQAIKLGKCVMFQTKDIEDLTNVKGKPIVKPFVMGKVKFVQEKK